MTADIWQLVSATLLVVLAGLFSAADAALGGFSRARAEEMRAEGRPMFYAAVKIGNVALNLALNFFFLIYLKDLAHHHPDSFWSAIYTI